MLTSGWMAMAESRSNSRPRRKVSAPKVWLPTKTTRPRSPHSPTTGDREEEPISRLSAITAKLDKSRQTVTAGVFIWANRTITLQKDRFFFMLHSGFRDLGAVSRRLFFPIFHPAMRFFAGKPLSEKSKLIRQIAGLLNLTKQPCARE